MQLSLWNSSPIKVKSRHHCRHFERYSAARPHFLDVIPSKGFCPNGFPHYPITTTLGYGCSWGVLSRAKNAANAQCESSENSEVDNPLQIIYFADLVKDAKSVAGFSPSHQFRVERSDVTLSRPSCLPNWRPPVRSRIFLIEYLQGSGSFRDWNFDEWKRWIFICYRRRQAFCSDLLL